MNKKYYLIVDNTMQCFTKLVGLDNNGDIVEFIDVHNRIDSNFLNSIFERELHFNSRPFRGIIIVGGLLVK